MRRAQGSDDGALVLISIALALMIAVLVSIAREHAEPADDDRFISVEPGNSFGFVSPLIAPGHDIRVNELPQIE